MKWISEADALPKIGQTVMFMSPRHKPLHCLGVAQDGHPRHPLMLAYATPMSQWQPLT